MKVNDTSITLYLNHKVTSYLPRILKDLCTLHPHGGIFRRLTAFVEDGPEYTLFFLEFPFAPFTTTHPSNYIDIYIIIYSSICKYKGRTSLDVEDIVLTEENDNGRLMD